MNILVPNRILLHLAGNSRRSILRDIARQAAIDLQLHTVGLHESLVTEGQGIIETRFPTGLVTFDGCMMGVNTPYMMMVRPLHAIAMDGAASQPSSLILLLLSPEQDHTGHVQQMNRLTRFLKQPDTLSAIRSATSVDQVISFFRNNAALDRQAA